MAEKRKDNKGRNLRTGEYQRKDLMYQYKYIASDGKPKFVYSKDLQELRKKEEQIKQDLKDGIKTKPENTITVNDMFDIYISTKTELKASTRTHYCQMYNRYVKDTFGTKKLNEVRYSDVKFFYNSLLKENKLKIGSVAIIHTILHPVFTLAVRDKYIRENPTNEVMTEIKKGRNSESKKRHALTEEQQGAFIDFVKNSKKYNHLLSLFTAFLGTGCRVGELIGLRWEDCDFNNDVISINHSLIYKPIDGGKYSMHITTPKTKAGERSIPMLPEVKKAFIAERKKQMQQGFDDIVIDGYSGFIFLNRKGYVYNLVSINKAIINIYKDYNAEETENAKKEKRKPILLPHFSVHILRHTFCTRFCENETNIKVIQEIMGHSDISTTMNIYAEATENKKQEAFKNLIGKIKIS